MANNAQLQPQQDPFLIALRNDIGLWRSEALWWQLQCEALTKEIEELRRDIDDKSA